MSVRRILSDREPALKPASSPIGAVRHIRSSSGAFDLPSIITGVVVIGVLAAGVLAAIFGVIPWAQDRSAKQDLAAINTAQGVTYAKDDQVYKDLAGLDDARLVSGLDAARTTVKTDKDGQTYSASVMSSSGKKWCTTNENTEPWECTEAPPGTAAPTDWPGAFCEPELKSIMDARMAMYLDPGVLEYRKAQMGMDYDKAAFASWIDTYFRGESHYDPDTIDPELAAVANDMSPVVQGALFSGINSLPATDVGEWPQLHAKAVEAYNAAGAAFCSSYTGPVAELKEHPSRAHAFKDQRQALTGSQEPVVLGYTLEFGDEDTFDIKSSGAEGLAGLQTASQSFEMVDGKPYWTTTLVPGPSGWGESAETAELTVTVTRKDDTRKVVKKERVWEIKANSNVLKFAQDPYLPGGDTPGYGDTWDHVIRHQGTLDWEINYAVGDYNGAVYVGSDPNALTYGRPEILDMTEGMDAVVNPAGGVFVDTGFVRTSNRIYGPNWEAPTNEGTVTFRQTVTNPKTFATASHVFSYTLVKPTKTGAPKLSLTNVSRTDNPYDLSIQLIFDVADGFNRSDYTYELQYAGETVTENGYSYAEISDGVWASISVWNYGTALNPGDANPYAMVLLSVDDYFEKDNYSKELTLKATYRPTGETTTITADFS